MPTGGHSPALWACRLQGRRGDRLRPHAAATSAAVAAPQPPPTPVPGTMVMVLPTWLVFAVGSLLGGVFLIMARVLLMFAPVLRGVLDASRSVEEAAVEINVCAREVKDLATLMKVDLEIVENIGKEFSKPLESAVTARQTAEKSLREKIYSLAPTLLFWRNKLLPESERSKAYDAGVVNGAAGEAPYCRIDGERREGRAALWLASLRNRAAKRGSKRSPVDKKQQAISSAVKAEEGLERALVEMEVALDACDEVGGCELPEGGGAGGEGQKVKATGPNGAVGGAAGAAGAGSLAEEVARTRG